MSNVIDKVADCLVRAGSTFREDQKEAYRKAIAEEHIASSCWVMKQVLDNALVAEKTHSPLCDDTGIPHLFLEVGKNRAVTGELLEEIKDMHFDAVGEFVGFTPDQVERWMHLLF